MKIALLAAGVAADLFDTFEDHWHSGEASGLKTEKIYALENGKCRKWEKNSNLRQK